MNLNEVRIRDLKNLLTHLNGINKTNHTRQAKQRKPIIGKIKGNCDANLMQNGRKGLGAIFKND
jgi:hypothetical protein